MGLNSQTLADTRIYAQDTQPTDERDGIIWVDTSVSPRDTYVYSNSSNSWEIISPESWTISDTAPNSPTDGDGWIDTSANPSRARVYNASTSNWRSYASENQYNSHVTDFNNHTGAAEPHHARPTAGAGITEDANGNFNTAPDWNLDAEYSDGGTTTLFNTGFIALTSYDEYMIHYSVSTDATGTDHLGFRFNGDGGATTNYYFQKEGGAANNSTSEINLAPGGIYSNFIAGNMRVFNGPTDGDVTGGGYKIKGTIDNATFVSQDPAVRFEYTNEITSLRLFMTGGTAGTGRIEIYGRNL